MTTFNGHTLYLTILMIEKYVLWPDVLIDETDLTI